MDDNLYDINEARRVRNMNRTVVIYEKQLADLKNSKKILEPHVDFRFFSITCHAMVAEQKNIAAELLRLRLRLDRAKNPAKYQLHLTTISPTQE